MSISYKDAGVDIAKGNSFVDNIKPIVKSTFDKNVMGGIGSFSGAYRLPTGYKNPILFGATDGVGTKLKLAIEAKKFDTIGIDLVAMCVNDLICSFANPMFFLDYYATARLDVDEATDVVRGIAEGCKQSECSLIGGETAEMPGMYSNDDFDLAGFATGIAEEEEAKSKGAKEGDILLALPSSGIHSNGYSLVRKLFFDKLEMTLDDEIEGKKLKDILLEPTRIYVKTYKKLKDKINAIAHITGGGITENLPRILPSNLSAVVNRSDIRTLPVFDFMSKYVELEEMYLTFNMGVGMVISADKKNVDFILTNSDAYVIGELVSGEPKVIFK
ncbi:MAG: Phosphoribosylformylglycinamidine cyclo-ligase (EC [uncultured Campylobacterales bacterium]|uniref:Phosphoribosylformylglycinamidine cyclo-ligase n=1 Tax=uncultured Campylobacterales bacterium TaxID=352960 RepID=A0A6S6T8S3_9BACT|nr:MAG: Phosphoribosylformylglycinamidine cyclo-ligase (EC [uncultured Campylobacterales bacterium]